MKTNRRGFFATLLAPLLGRLMPKFPWPTNPVALNGTPKNVSLNGWKEWDDWFSIAPYGGISRSFIPPTMAREAARIAKKQLVLQLVVQKYLPKEVLLEEDPEIET